ncbi:hypothetical protein SAMN05421638_1470 [Kaistella treverensis]|uniref:Uncharacterized protein n=1 Tax=Kaistella treverensis TaxID=631455 RepID=A0A1I3M1A8_9FLAO|nr:hypothetical protein SAMN05421638_1470 [Kaistella treverensis]
MKNIKPKNPLLYGQIFLNFKTKKSGTLTRNFNIEEMNVDWFLKY